MQELLRRRTDRLGLDLVDESVGDADVAIVEQLADDQFVELLAVLQAHFGSIHPGQGEDNSLPAARESRWMKG